MEIYMHKHLFKQKIKDGLSFDLVNISLKGKCEVHILLVGSVQGAERKRILTLPFTLLAQCKYIGRACVFCKFLYFCIVLTAVE